MLMHVLFSLLKVGVLGFACSVPALGESTQQQLVVKTENALRLGVTRVGFSGSIASSGGNVEYWFEYGESPRLGNRTEKRQLPARRLAFYEENWDDRSLAGWYGGVTGMDLVRAPWVDKNGGVSLRLGTGADINHSDGIGMLHLGPFFYCGTKTALNGELGAHLSGGAVDLRNALVSCEIRGRDLVLNGAELLWWFQTDHDIEKQNTAEWRRANWALTGQPLTEALTKGTWTRVQFRLPDRFEAWTYAGANVSQARDNYSYFPLGNSLSAVNCNFFLVLAYANHDKPPQGVIDVRNFRIDYPNRSVVLEANGARILGNAASGDLARGLVDGWRHGDRRSWDTVGGQPSEVVFELQREEMIETVQLHQHQKWPAKDVQVMVSNEGLRWKTIAQTTMPRNSLLGSNFAFRVFRGLHAPARYIKLVVQSGYLPERHGLGELEVFASDARLPSDVQDYPVTGETELEPGAGVSWFRIVAKTGTEVFYGDVRPCSLPSRNLPFGETGDSLRIGIADATVSARITGFGRLTNYYFEYGKSPAFGYRTATYYAGSQQEPHTVLAHIVGLAPNSTYLYRIVVLSDAGVAFGVDKSLQTKSDL
jgi:hypothetical protein